MPRRRRRAAASAVAVLLALVGLPLAGACVKANPPTDVGSPVSPSSSGGGTTSLPSPTGSLAYTPDMKPFFDADCVYCHNDSFASGRYSMSTYAAVMRDVIPGSAASPLVYTTQPSGNMYRYFSGDRATKAALVMSWVVTSKAAQAR